MKSSRNNNNSQKNGCNDLEYDSEKARIQSKKIG
jgi:hypothetical protein